MDPEIIVQRFAPTCDLLVVVPAEPEAALARFGFVDQRPAFWSWTPRVTAEAVSSAAGSNVTFRIHFPVLWTGVLVLLFTVAVAAGSMSYRLGPIDRGYGVATTRYLVPGPASVVLGCICVGVVILGAFLWHVLRSRRRIVEALRD